MKQRQKITKVIPFAVILLAFLLMPVLGLNSRSWINLFITIVINIVVACSLRVITLSGNMSFAHGAFMGVGAYTAGMLGVYLSWPIWLTIPLGAILATIAGVLTGWPFGPAQDHLLLHGHHVYGPGHRTAHLFLGFGRRRHGAAGHPFFEYGLGRTGGRYGGRRQELSGGVLSDLDRGGGVPADHVSL